jgi:copper resistance protein D
MDNSIWLIATSISKLMLYSCMAGAVGGVGIYWLNRANSKLIKSTHKYVLISVGLGLLLVVFNFIIQVGALNEQGLSGMFDPMFMQVLWESTLGDSTIFRIGAFILILLLSYSLPLATQKSSKLTTIVFLAGLYLVSLITFGYSFSLVGHVAELPIEFRLAISVHVSLVLIWIGMLWPLRRSCMLLEARELQQLMHRFGMIACYAVAMIILCGILLGLALIEQPADLVETSYGQVLLLKLVLVVAILLIAAYHKLVVVPSLLKTSTAKLKLARSIQYEMVIAIFILCITAILTTYTGPMNR